MAQNAHKLFLRAKALVYANPAFAPVIIAAQNSAFKAELMSNKLEYNVQRKKRPVVQSVAAGTASSTADDLKMLDSFTVPAWESIEVSPSARRFVGIKGEFADTYDMDATDLHLKDMEASVLEVAVKRLEDVTNLIKTATATGSALPAFVKGDTKVWDAIADEVITLSQVDDEFATIQDVSSFIIYGSAQVAKTLTKEMGTVFNQEAPIAQTGFKTGMQVNGTPFVSVPTLTGDEVIIVHNYAIGFATAPKTKAINIDLGLHDYVGEVWMDVMAVVDSARMAKISA